MSWAEERRADRVAKAEEARLDADAASKRRIRERNALAEQARLDEAMRVKQGTAALAQSRAASKARWAAVRAWAGEHTVDLLIYPLALASAVMAIPSMANYGKELYGDGTGVVLPVLSELGMWAFAVAVTLSRRLHPTRPVWALQLGIAVFAASGFGINFAHGFDKKLSTGVVMGFASIAGVIAHQLVTASPRRSGVDRVEARIARRAVRKAARIRSAAVRHAVAEIDQHGNAALVFTPGRYVLGKGGRLTTAIVQGLPVDPVDDLSDTLGDEVTAWLAELDQPSTDDPSTRANQGPVATIDRDDDLHESTPDPNQIGDPVRRSLDDLRVELRARLTADPDSIDPSSAQSIRKALRCGAARARQLRNEFRPTT
jgi:hypothetical protein